VLHDSARYDANLAPQQQVVCIACRRIRDIEIAEMGDLLGASPSLEGFETIGWSLEIQALCHDCRRRQRGAKKQLTQRQINPGVD
jgi:Fe2+ or Zn2+ uptake regulation protein